MSLVIRKCGIAEAESLPNFSQLMDEYAKELLVDGAPPAAAKMELYRALEANDSLVGFGAFLDDVLIGFVTVLVTVLPHYGVLMAVTESFFVLREFRGTGAGLKLLDAAERNAKERGAPCILVSAPSGGDLAQVLPRVNYVETNRVFFRRLGHV